MRRPLAVFILELFKRRASLGRTLWEAGCAGITAESGPRRAYRAAQASFPEREHRFAPLRGASVARPPARDLQHDLRMTDPASNLADVPSDGATAPARASAATEP